MLWPPHGNSRPLLWAEPFLEDVGPGLDDHLLLPMTLSCPEFHGEPSADSSSLWPLTAAASVPPAMIPLGALQSGGCSPGLISGWSQDLVVSDRKSGIAEFKAPHGLPPRHSLNRWAWKSRPFRRPWGTWTKSNPWMVF